MPDPNGTDASRSGPDSGEAPGEAEAPALDSLLTPEQRALLQEERRLLSELQSAVAAAGAGDAGDGDDRRRLAEALAQLDELFLLVVAGEFNAGKSAVVNTLVGERVLAEGVTPTTTRIQVLRHADHPPRGTAGTAGAHVVTSRAPVLEHLDVVDTPGTNAIDREHEALTREFVPRADMVLFVTSADRPFTESERAFLEAIRDWGKKIAIVVNKIDIIHADDDVARIEAFVAESAVKLLDRTPAIFPVSARKAMRSKLGRGEAGDGGGETGTEEAEEAERLWRESRFGALESYIVDTLDETERVRLKLLSPLRVGRRVGEAHRSRFAERERLLADDFQALEDIERQLAVYREDMRREFRFRLADVDNALHELERRGVDFFEDTLRLGRVFDLANKTRIKSEFERRVIGDLPQEIERRVGEVIDWLVEKELAQWKAVEAHVAARRQAAEGRIVGGPGKGFEYDRARLLDTVGRAARETVASYDREREADRLAESTQLAVAGAAALEAGALGLGAIVAAVTMSSAADVTGILAAVTLSTLGLFVIPAKRRQAQEEFRGKIEALRERLTSSLTAQFDREMEAGARRIEEAVAPYTRFVRAERSRLDEQRELFDGLLARAADLEASVEALG